MHRYAFALLPVIAFAAFYIRRRIRSRRQYISLTAGGGGAAGSFRDDVERGLTSDTFDLASNITAGDARPGVGDGDEVLEIMEEMGCSFDQARLIRQQRLFRANGIDPQTGLPLDSKAVYFNSS